MRSGYEQREALGPFLQGFVFAVIAAGVLLVLLWVAGEPINNNSLPILTMTFVMSLVIFSRFDMFRHWELGRVGSIGTQVYMAWVFVAAILVLAGFASMQIDFLSRWVLLAWLILTPVAFSLCNSFARHVLLRIFPGLTRTRSAVIVFVNPLAQHLADVMKTLDSPRFKLLGYFEDRAAERTGHRAQDMPILGHTGELVDYVNKHAVEVVFVVLPAHGADRAFGVVEQLGDTTASIYYAPDFRMFDLTSMRFSDVGGMPVLTFGETPFFGADGMFKRIMDITFSATVLVLLAPMFLIIAAIIVITMGRPVFFTQRRYGLDGKEIKVHKFRSMGVLEDGEVITQVMRDDPRITPIGRFLRRTSMDEWPQFWNVLKGEMSIVGPRPHAVSHNETYRKLIKRYMARHKVKPGMTGWAQVNGLRGETRDVTDMQRRVQFDLDYIQRWSPELDIRIILKTCWIIFQDHEAY